MKLTGIGLLPSDLNIVVPGDTFRNHQLEVVERILNSTKRFIVLKAPTGSGKSLIAQAIFQILGNRAIVLTKTRDLQYQYEQQGIFGLYGRDNYVCNRFPLVSAANGICHIGQSCALRHGGCDYYDQKRAAVASRSVVLNYSYFFLEANGPGEFAQRDWIIADEAHSIPDELSRAYTIRINHVDLRKFGITVPKHADRLDFSKWSQWATNTKGKVFGLSKHATGDRAVLLNRIRTAIVGIISTTTPENWVCETDNYKTIIRPVWVDKIAKEYVWSHASKFLLMSATINPAQTLAELGIDAQDAEIIEIPSTFPVSSHPIRYFPAVKFSRNTTESEIKELVNAIDRILDAHNGSCIVHTGNYSLASHILSLSRHKARLIGHTKDNRGESIARFKSSSQSYRPLRSRIERSDATIYSTGSEFPNGNESTRSNDRQETGPANASRGKVLVSPSLTEGLDFPYEQCEAQIIARLPFPNRVDPVWAARFFTNKTKGELAYTATVVSTIVQATGRGMRANDDHCITYILDSNFGWLYNQQLANFPRHFREALRTIQSLAAL